MTRLQDGAVVDLPYDPCTGRVLRGRYRGLYVADARVIEAGRLRLTFPSVEVQRVALRPWWALWHRTPAVRLVATPMIPAPAYAEVRHG